MKISTFKNAYGILNLNNDKTHCFGANEIKSHLIYAPNGTFKSSFAKTLYEWSTGNTNIKDRLNNKTFIGSVTVDGKDYIYPNRLKNVLVYSTDTTDDNDYSDYIKTLLMSKVDRKAYDKVLKLLSSHEYTMNKIINSSRLTNDIYIKIVGKKPQITKLIDFFTTLNEAIVVPDLSKVIDFNKITQKVYETFDDPKFNEQFIILQEMIVSRLASSFYDDNFTESKGIDFLSQLSKLNYLSKEKKRGLYINDTTYYDYDGIKTYFEERLTEVIKDPEIVSQTKKIESNFTSGVEAGRLKSDLLKYPSVAFLMPHGRENIIYSELKRVLDFSLDTIITELFEIKQTLDALYASSVNNKSTYEVIVSEYNLTFQPIFEVNIGNMKDCISDEKPPIIEFKHLRDDSSASYSKDQMNTFLSSGEKSTLKVLDFMFNYLEMRSKIGETEELVIVLDDIVETFDYRNRAGFLSYIHKLLENENNSLILLTHNFEFYNRVYRSVSKDHMNALVASADKQGNVKIGKNKNIHFDVFNQFESPTIKQFLYRIPFYRELANLNNNKILSDELTCCLHFKEKTKQMSIKSIVKQLIDNRIIPSANLEDLNYFDTLIAEAERLSGQLDYFDISNKIILSIASRLLIEMVITNNDVSKASDISRNQIRELYHRYKNDLNHEMLELLNKVLLLTPDFIHANNFMFEPLIDIDPKDLQDLYKKVKSAYDNLNS